MLSSLSRLRSLDDHFDSKLVPPEKKPQGYFPAFLQGAWSIVKTAFYFTLPQPELNRHFDFLMAEARACCEKQSWNAAAQLLTRATNTNFFHELSNDPLETNLFMTESQGMPIGLELLLLLSFVYLKQGKSAGVRFFYYAVLLYKEVIPFCKPTPFFDFEKLNFVLNAMDNWVAQFITEQAAKEKITLSDEKSEKLLEENSFLAAALSYTKELKADPENNSARLGRFYSLACYSDQQRISNDFENPIFTAEGERLSNWVIAYEYDWLACLGRTLKSPTDFATLTKKFEALIRKTNFKKEDHAHLLYFHYVNILKHITKENDWEVSTGRTIANNYCHKKKFENIPTIESVMKKIKDSKELYETHKANKERYNRLHPHFAIPTKKHEDADLQKEIPADKKNKSNVKSINNVPANADTAAATSATSATSTTSAATSAASTTAASTSSTSSSTSTGITLLVLKTPIIYVTATSKRNPFTQNLKSKGKKSKHRTQITEVTENGTDEKHTDNHVETFETPAVIPAETDIQDSETPDATAETTDTTETHSEDETQTATEANQDQPDAKYITQNDAKTAVENDEPFLPQLGKPKEKKNASTAVVTTASAMPTKTETHVMPTDSKKQLDAISRTSCSTGITTKKLIPHKTRALQTLNEKKEMQTSPAFTFSTTTTVAVSQNAAQTNRMQLSYQIAYFLPLPTVSTLKPNIHFYIQNTSSGIPFLLDTTNYIPGKFQLVVINSTQITHEIPDIHGYHLVSFMGGSQQLPSFSPAISFSTTSTQNPLLCYLNLTSWSPGIFQINAQRIVPAPTQQISPAYQTSLFLK